MNKYKKIGLTALAGSLVATSAFAGELGVSGSASINMEHTNGGAADKGKTFSMGNQITFSGSGELDNGMTVSLSFTLDQGDDTTAASGPFDGHSVTVSSDTLGTIKFSGEGGKSSTAAIDTSAAGDLWDNYDDEEMEPTETGTSDNMFMYTLPAMVDGISANVSYEPTGEGSESAIQYGVTYSGIDGLSVSYATGDDSTPVADAASASVFKASYAYGPVTVAYSDFEYDHSTNSNDDDMTAAKISYTVSDEISISYATEEVETGTLLTAEYEEIAVDYTSGGMTLSASMGEATDIDGTTTATEDRERWYLGASFAF
jgi:outer membrane protein OmpU